MTQEQSIASLIIGLVIALGVGFVIGYGVHEEQRYPQVCPGAEQTKAAMEEVKSCYRMLADHLGAKPQETAH